MKSWRAASKSLKSSLTTTGPSLNSMRITKPEAVVISFSDMTGRRKVEQDLLKKAIRRRILMEQSRGGIVVLDQNSQIHEANQ
jgi:PAS domain-containing protein